MGNTGYIMRYLAIIIAIFILASCSDRHVEELIELHNVDLQSPVSVIAWTDVAEVTIGDKIRYTVTIISDTDLEINVPQFGENLFGGFGIKDFGEEQPREIKGKTVREQWYLLDIYVTGTYKIPPPVARFTGVDNEPKEIKGNEVSIDVVSVIADGEDPADIRDITEPEELPMDYTPHILVGVGIAILIAGGIVAYILLRRRKKEEMEIPQRAAHEIAYEQLQGIADAHLVDTGEIEKYYILLSAVVRHYLENRFELHAPEMTTEEFLQIVAQADQLVKSHNELLQEFLTESDLVKFARYNPDEKQMKLAFDYAKRFVDETRVDLTEQFTVLSRTNK